MKNEREKTMKLITQEKIDSDVNLKEDNIVQQEQKTYQSDPNKLRLYSQMLAFNKSQKKFGIKELIKDSLR